MSQQMMRKRTTTTLSILFILVLLITGCEASGWFQGASATQIHIDEPWARADTTGQNSAAYMTIRNSGDQPDWLIEASSDVAATVEIHESTGEHGVMKMREVESVEVPAGESIELRPGGYHVMFMGLTRDLMPGDAFTLQLTFQHAGAVDIVVEVQERTSRPH